ncbi:thermostable hemolysin [Labrys monachus]|uniref:Thermostable hemolysin n=1 Tax=Labrys monachus TaxID=217067 RepID=A0ABU0F8L1_9HYPH|nr:thermostable hemolysin [Labrys monachus]MDQ0390954.1 hypothetical protein [Labrys monachus]
MKRIYIVDAQDVRRSNVELFIKNVYSLRYGAHIDEFPSRLISLVDGQDNVICAAGIRTADDGFFSEKYLDMPIDTALSAMSGAPIARSEVFEVSTLASRSPKNILDFIKVIISFGEDQRFQWSFFTLTARLHNLLMRIGIAPVYLADADKSRVSNFERWGSYYDFKPMIYAVAGPVRMPGRPGAIRHAAV